MLERLGLAVEQYDAGETTSEINVIASWMHSVRAVFDLMPVEGEQAHRDLAVRMAAVPGAYAGLRRTYAESAAQGRVAARRQIEGCAKKCASWSAADGGFYVGLAGRTGATGSLRAQLDKAAQAASAATAEFGRFLQAELLPLAPDRDAVGRERYALAARSFLGVAIDLDEAYAWGWAEVGRIEAEMARVAGQIVPGGTVEQAVAALEADPARRITGRENLRVLDARLRRQHHDRTARHALRHPRASPPDRGHDRPGQRRRHLLQRPERGLVQAGPDLVVTARRHRRVLYLAGDLHHPPRGSTRPSPADRRGQLPNGPAQPLAAHAVVRLRPRRGLGTVRRTAHGRAGLPR